MCCLLYICFAFSLGGWVISSGNVQNKGIYCMCIIFLIVLGLLSCRIWKNSRHIQMCIIIALVFVNIGTSVACRMGYLSFSEYMQDITIMTFVFILAYLVIRFTRLYRLGGVNVIICMTLPLTMIAARVTNEPVNGSYIYFAGVLVFGLILCGYPFAVAYFASGQELKFLGGNVRHLSWNLMSLLLYTFLLFIGCALCNEFGLLLILGMTTTCVFYIRCKNRLTKMFYSLACMVGVLVTSITIGHIYERIFIWLNLSEAIKDKNLAGKAEWILYLFRTLKQTGWWGKGIGAMPSAGVYQTLNTDHVLITLINDFSVFIAILVIALGVVLVWLLLRGTENLELYDNYLNLCIALIVGFIMVIHISSCLGSFITAGIGFPWISDGGSANIMFTLLLGVHCALVAKGEDI